MHVFASPHPLLNVRWIMWPHTIYSLHRQSLLVEKDMSSCLVGRNDFILTVYIINGFLMPPVGGLSSIFIVYLITKMLSVSLISPLLSYSGTSGHSSAFEMCVKIRNAIFYYYYFFYWPFLKELWRNKCATCGLFQTSRILKKCGLFIGHDITLSSVEMQLPPHILSINNSGPFFCPVLRQKAIDHECVISMSLDWLWERGSRIIKCRQCHGLCDRRYFFKHDKCAANFNSIMLLLSFNLQALTSTFKELFTPLPVCQMI